MLAAACATPPAPEPGGPVDRLAKIEHAVGVLRATYDPAKPPVDQLTAIEGEIHDLTQQLGQSDAATAPASAPVEPPGKPVALAPPPEPAPATGQFALHLATYKLKSSVAEGWADYRKQYHGVLDRLNPRVAEIDLHDGRGTLYRLLAGPYDTAAAAEATCKKIATYPAGYCRVMAFSGMPGAEFWRKAS
jgi:hypothetical protein